MGQQETFLSEFGSPSGLSSFVSFFPFACHKYNLHSIAQRKEPKDNNLASRDMSFPYDELCLLVFTQMN
jgi:hypothetical protein